MEAKHLQNFLNNPRNTSAIELFGFSCCMFSKRRSKKKTATVNDKVLNDRLKILY